jgi:hypothetical protein
VSVPAACVGQLTVFHLVEVRGGYSSGGPRGDQRREDEQGSQVKLGAGPHRKAPMLIHDSGRLDKRCAIPPWHSARI